MDEKRAYLLLQRVLKLASKYQKLNSLFTKEDWRTKSDFIKAFTKEDMRTASDFKKAFDYLEVLGIDLLPDRPRLSGKGLRNYNNLYARILGAAAEELLCQLESLDNVKDPMVFSGEMFLSVTKDVKGRFDIKMMEKNHPIDKINLVYEPFYINLLILFKLSGVKDVKRCELCGDYFLLKGKLSKKTCSDYCRKKKSKLKEGTK